MSFDPFKKIGEDMKKGFQKMQEDFNQFFNLPKKPETNSMIDKPHTVENNTPDVIPSSAPKTSNLPNTSGENAIVERPASVQDNWNNFMKSAQDNTKYMQEQWDANYIKFQEKLKKSSDSVKSQLTQANTNMQNMFANQQEQMKAFFSKINQDIQTANDKNREKMLQSVSTMATGWNQFIHKQQIQFEQTMGKWNKLAFRGQLNFILWLIPILILMIVIFSVLKPFFSFIP